VSDQLEVSLLPNGTAVTFNHRGDLIVFHPTAHADVFTYLGRPDPDMQVSLIRCGHCRGWSRKVISALDAFFCADCAREVTTKFLSSRLSDQYELPKRDGSKPQGRRP